MKNIKIIVGILVVVCLLIQGLKGHTAELGGTRTGCCTEDRIIVNGEGKVKYQADIAIMSIGISSTNRTSADATKTVALKIDRIQKILADKKIPKSDIETQSLTINPIYEYPDGKQTFIGQRAQQTLQVTIRNIDKNNLILGSLIDQLVQVNGLQFNSLRFDKADKTLVEQKVRKLAFENARKKAKQLSLYAVRSLGKVVTIVDNSGTLQPPVYSEASSFSAKVGTSVSVGDLQTSSSVQVTFAMN